MYSYNYYPVTTCIIQILFIYDEGVCTYFFIAVLYFQTLLNCIIQVSVVSALQSNLLDLICSSVTLCYLIKVWLRLINKSANFSSTLYASFADHHNLLMILDPNTYYYFRSLLFYQGFFYLICVTLLILTAMMIVPARFVVLLNSCIFFCYFVYA